MGCRMGMVARPRGPKSGGPVSGQRGEGLIER